MKIIKITRHFAIVINPKEIDELELVVVNLAKDKFEDDTKKLYELIKKRWKINQTWQFESAIVYELYHDIKIL